MYRTAFLHNFNRGVDTMLNTQTKLAQTQEMINTGKKFTHAGDDPVNMSKVMDLEHEQSRLTNYIENAKSLKTSASLEDKQLQRFNEIIIDVRQKALHVANGVLTGNDRQSIQLEIKQRLGELVGIANTRNSSGEYIFSGFKGDTPAFKEVREGVFEYQGDEGQRMTKVGPNTTLAVNDSGRDVFQGAAVKHQMFFTEGTSTNTIGVNLGNAKVLDQGLLAESDPEGYTVTYNDDAAGSPPQPYFVVEGRSDGSTENIALTQDKRLVMHGMEMQLNGTPANGDSFTVDSSSKPRRSIMDTVAKLIKGIDKLGENTEDKKKYQLLMAESLENLSNAREHISTINSKVGARLNTIESTQTTNEEMKLQNKKVIMNLHDVDYTEAIAKLSQQTFSLQAAQQSFSKINNLSLFNFMR